MEDRRITIYTQVYNTEKYLRNCLDSVVNQTYPIHQYIVVDNGCTDGCSEIIKEYAEKYDFIEVVKHETNQRRFWHKLVLEKMTGDYIMTLDSDDWLELNCLEKAVSQLENDDYDIVAFGSRFCDENLKEFGLKKVEKTIFMKPDDYPVYYTEYYDIFRTVWGKLLKKDLFFKSVEKYDNCDLLYGSDTYFAFCALRNANNVLVLDDVLHNYVIHRNSVSRKYAPKQSDSDIILFNDAIDFLSQYGEISQKNMDFIYWVYANAIKDTVRNLIKSNLSVDEKLDEYLKIFKRPETQKAFLLDDEKIQVYKCELLFGFLSLATKVKNEFEKVLQVLTVFSPDCVSVINKDNINLFAENDTFKTILFNDDKNALVNCILTLIEKNDSILKQYDFASMLQKLSSEHSLVKNIEDVEFVRLYNSVYRLLWNVQNSEALQKMIEILLSGNELECPEDFLNVFVTLAALENNVDAFIFGNIQKAYLFIDEKRFDEAKRIVTDLIEMGLSDNEDVIELQKILKN